MAEYIEREALREEIQIAQEGLESDNDIVWEMNKKYFAGLAWAHRLVLDAPAADVAPVVRAKWEPSAFAYGFVRCGNCKDELSEHWGDSRKWPRCNVCGARMDGK